jgi:hypothetical protein
MRRGGNATFPIVRGAFPMGNAAFLGMYMTRTTGNVTFPLVATTLSPGNAA